jgi:hypothetical protein
MALFVKMNNPNKSPEKVLNAEIEKISLRVELGLEDMIERMEKHRIFERFSRN